MLAIEYTNQFKRDVKKAKKRSKKIAALHHVMELIEKEKPIPTKMKDHVLSGNWNQHRELHIESDWLLIYKIIHHKKTVIFTRTGTHADLFNK